MSCCCEERLDRRRGFFRRRLYYVPSSSSPALLRISTAAAKRQCHNLLLARKICLFRDKMFGTPANLPSPNERLGFYKGDISLTAAHDAMQLQDTTKRCSMHNLPVGSCHPLAPSLSRNVAVVSLTVFPHHNRKSNSAPAMSSVTAGRPAENVYRR